MDILQNLQFILWDRKSSMGTANVLTIVDGVVDRKGVVARNAGDIGDTDIAQAVEDMVDDRRHEIWVPSYELPRRANAPSNGLSDICIRPAYGFAMSEIA